MSTLSDRLRVHRDVDFDGLFAEAADELDRLTAELKNWTNWGIIEVAIRNPSVSEYMNHWECRALKAEARVAELENLAARQSEAEAILLELIPLCELCDIDEKMADDGYGWKALYLRARAWRDSRAAIGESK